MRRPYLDATLEPKECCDPRVTEVLARKMMTK
jgi:hypothetical protein